MSESEKTLHDIIKTQELALELRERTLKMAEHRLVIAQAMSRSSAEFARDMTRALPLMLFLGAIVGWLAGPYLDRGLTFLGQKLVSAVNPTKEIPQ